MLPLWGLFWGTSVIFLFQLPHIFLALQGASNVVSLWRNPGSFASPRPLLLWSALALALLVHTGLCAVHPLPSFLKIGPVLGTFLGCSFLHAIHTCLPLPRPRTLALVFTVLFAALAFQFFSGALLTQGINGLALLGDSPLLRIPPTLKPHLTLLSLAYWGILGAWVRESHTGSRGPMVGMVCLGILLLWLSWSMKASSVFLGLIAGGLVWIGCFFFQRFPLAALGKITLVCLTTTPLLMLNLGRFLEAKVLRPKGAFHTLGERFRHWQEVVSHIAHHPFWGGGLGYSRTVSGIDNLEHPLMFPHNVPLEIWLDLGGVGVFLVLLGLWRMLERLARTPDRLFRATSGACATFVVVINQTSYSAFHTWWLSAVCLASFWVPFLVKDRQALSVPSAPSCLA